MSTPPWTYSSGDVPQAGDRVLYASEPGEVEFVVMDGICIPAQEWGTEWDGEFPNGAMITTASMGHVFVQPDDGDLDFVSRK